MKSKATILAVLALVGVTLVITGCPRGHRPHIPRPHRLPLPVLPVDSLLQVDGLNNAKLTMLVAESPRTVQIKY